MALAKVVNRFDFLKLMEDDGYVLCMCYCINTSLHHTNKSGPRASWPLGLLHGNWQL